MFASRTSIRHEIFSLGPAQVQSKRQQIVREIYDTEYSYISQLNTIITVRVRCVNTRTQLSTLLCLSPCLSPPPPPQLFLKPTELGSFLPTTAIRAIFSNMEEILAINQQLFSRMRQRSLGEAFSNFGPYLKLYSTYARDYQASNETLVVCSLNLYCTVLRPLRLCIYTLLHSVCVHV